MNLAHQLAVEQHPLSHWKEVLDEFQESLHQAALEEQARLHAKEEKEKKKAAKKATKTVEEGDVADDEDDITMDVGADSEPKKKKQKKRELTEGETKSEVRDHFQVEFMDISLTFNLQDPSCKENQAKYVIQVGQRYACLVCKAKV